MTEAGSVGAEQAGASVSPGRASARRDQPGEAWLLYDGECPFCSRYVAYLRLRASLQQRLHLIDARKGGPLVDEVARRGLDLNEGMALKYGNRWYHGADCIHVLALLSSSAGWFNRINAAVFRSPTAARWLYPILRTGRNAVLRVLGRSQITVSDS